MAGFGDNSVSYQRSTGTSSLRFELGGYTQATDATAQIPTTLTTVVFGLCVADGSTVGAVATGNTSGTVDFSIRGGGGTFNGKEVQYIVAGY